MPGRCERVLMLGIDGLPPAQLDTFLRTDELPNFAKLLSNGTRFDAIPTLPALTSPGWPAIASGCLPSSLGVENILLPTPGQRPNDIRNGFDASLSKADFIWQMLADAGRSALVVKYPGSWPPRPGDFTQIDGAGGYADIKCRFEALSSTAYLSDDHGTDPSPAMFPEGYRDHWRIDTGSAASLVKVRPRAPSDWQLELPAHDPVFEFTVPSHGGARPLFALACRIGGAAKLVLATAKRGKPLVILGAGDWSEWLPGSKAGESYKYRYKLIALSLEERRVHLYQSDGHLLSGYTKPPQLAQLLSDAVGPPIEWTGTFDLMNGLVDLATQLEIYRYHTEWLCRTLEWMATQRPWHGLFVHWHALEYAHHIVGVSLSRDHPLHDPRLAKRDVEFLREVYRLADRLLGTIWQIADETTGIVLASDHGHDLVHSLFFINHWLAAKGWLTLVGGEIDWSRTTAYGLFPGCIHINDRNRWACGIVEADQVLEIAAAVRRDLMALTDPRTGKRVVTHALGRAELKQWGQSGARAPDVFACLDRGYECATRIVPSAADVTFKLTEPYRDETSGHGSFYPDSASARTLAVFAGPGIPAGRRGDRAISVIDIAPTILALLGVPVPAQCNGRAIELNGGRA
jgi:predicted AlkP superfamily phosphohydrolase/phosphomutase